MNKHNLDNNGEDDNSEEESVVEEASEDVVVIGSQFTRVNLVEDLHKHEGVEDDGVVASLISGLVQVSSNIEGSVSGVIKAKELLACEEHHNQESGLEYELTNNVTPHYWCHDHLSSAVRRLLKNSVSRGFSSESKSSEGIHD